jgi:hypothetical protein
VRVDVQQIQTLIQLSNLTDEQKREIAGFKIVRGDRSTNRSIVAKGILRNVGKYEREGTEYYFPNYPYNDLRQDPFLVDKSNGYTIPLASASTSNVCRRFRIFPTDAGVLKYINCYTGETIYAKLGPDVDDDYPLNQAFTLCALDFPAPVFEDGAKGAIISETFTWYKIEVEFNSSPFIVAFNFIPPVPPGIPPSTPGCGIDPEFGGSLLNPPAPYSNWTDWAEYCALNPGQPCCVGHSAPASTLILFTTNAAAIDRVRWIPSLAPPRYGGGTSGFSPQYTITPEAEVGYECNPNPLKGFDSEGAKKRHVFNSPETSFGQPFLGNILKLENVIFGAGSAHFVKVKKNAMYRLVSREAQQDALAASNNIANITSPYNASALFAAYQAYLTIYVNGITRRNYAYSYNSIASYDYSNVINNGLGIKQRQLDLKQYLIPGVQSAGDDRNINNWNRESSVYLKTDEARPGLPFPSNTPSISGLVTDESRTTISEAGNCDVPAKEEKISVVSYYGSLKNIFVNQYGQIYSYDTVDTGFQRDITPLTGPIVTTFFGGDTFISKFAFKTKLPFFIDNRVNAPDDSDIFYDEIGNVAYPKYWHSSRSILSDASVNTVVLTNFISIKANNLDCPNSQTPASAPGRTFYDGKMYLFAYGIPYFYCESSYNVDLRQAFDNRAGDFWPHVSTNIPDDWVQEDFVSIANDNTYYYNTTFSKQNRENTFTHLPYDWKKECFTEYPFRAIYSDAQDASADNRSNNWLIYRALSYFDFPQNYGPLVSLDGIQNKAILARFENKSLLYNTLLTIDTSNPKAAYMGNDSLFRSSPPIDFAETDLGFVGSQNKMLLKIPQGQVSVDAKRGQIFLISGNQAQDLSAFGSGMNRFFTDHLAFEILRYFPNVPIDNHFKGLGLHGVYDSKFDRIILTKLDYIPKLKNIIYDETDFNFYLEEEVQCCDGTEIIRKQVYLTDLEYFCNKSWTLSFNLNTKSWVSFHSYIPNWYIAENNFFYSGLNDCCGDFEAIVANPVPNTTTTTTTQFVCECNTYLVDNQSISTLVYDYVDCNNVPQFSVPIEGGTTQEVCVCGNQINGEEKGLSITLISAGCITTTTTTTIYQPDCSLEGEAVERCCDLEGTACAEPTTTTTTTTTVAPDCIITGTAEEQC